MLTEERDEDLWNAFCQAVKKHGKYASLVSRAVLCETAVRMPAPRFYVTAEHAAKLINKYQKQKGISTSQIAKQAGNNHREGVE